MAFWNRRPQRYAANVHVPQGVVAGAQRFDLENEGDRAKLAKLQQQWQADVAVYADSIGPLKDSSRFVENSFRRIKLFAGYRREADEELIPVNAAMAPEPGDPAEERTVGEDPTEADDYLDPKWAQMAEDVVAGWAARDGGQSALMARAGVNIFLIGEMVTIQRATLERRPLAGEDPAVIPRVWDWEVRAPVELKADPQDSKRTITVDAPEQQTGTPIEGLADSPPFVERIYRKHWMWSGWADSNCRAAVGKLEEIRLLDLVARASLRSRAMAGVWTIPDELDFDAADQPGDQGGARKTVTFDQSFAEAISSSILNEAEAASVAPTLVRGKKEFLSRDVFGPIEMPRRYGADERAQREEAIVDLGRTIELPQERLTGVSDVNHWTAWQIDEDTYRAYIEPLGLVLTEGLTFGLLRPILAAEGCPPEILDRLFVGADASQLVRRADRGKVAGEGLTNDSLGWAAWRKANGFADDDAPTIEELALRIALRTRESPALGAILLEQAGLIPAGTADRVIASGTTAGQPGVVPTDQAPEDAPADQAAPEGDPAPEASTASATPRTARVGARLSAIDSSLRDRLLVLCDQAVMRTLERAGSRLRTAGRSASAPAEVRAAVASAKDVPNARLGQAVGAAVVAAALGPDPVNPDDFSDLHDRFDRWTMTAQTSALAELASLAGDRLSDAQLLALRTRQAEDRDAAWSYLLAGLVAYTGRRLSAAEDAEELTGEWEPTAVVRPSLVRSALAIAGGVAIAATVKGGVERQQGGAAGGPATGDTMTQAFAEAGYPQSGYVWVYGSEPRATPFEDHLRLDGMEFSSWDDPALEGNEPGDHANCLCDFEPVVEEAAQESTEEPDEAA